MTEIVQDIPPALIRKLEELSRRHTELETQLSDPQTLSNSQKLTRRQGAGESPPRETIQLAESQTPPESENAMQTKGRG